MMHDFLANNRQALIERCRIKVAHRPARAATAVQLRDGVPLFLDQLIRTLAIEQGAFPEDSQKISGLVGGGASQSEMGQSAAEHGRKLLDLGFSVDQVVHDYGDLCQAITDLAVERDAPFLVSEFRTLNRCLDNAIADAVTEFSYQRDFLVADKQAHASAERLGFFAHELRNFLGTATLAFAALKAGNLPLSGATGTVLGHSLNSLRDLIDSALLEVREARDTAERHDVFSLAKFIAQVAAAAELAATAKGCTLAVSTVDPRLAVSGEPELLFSALGNLLQNAFKFTRPKTEVVLNAYAIADRILLDVKDHGGGLAPHTAERMFLPFTQYNPDKTGLGLGLTIARRSVESLGGTLSVRNVAGTGCVFTISLPRHAIEMTAI